MIHPTSQDRLASYPLWIPCFDIGLIKKKQQKMGCPSLDGRLCLKCFFLFPGSLKRCPWPRGNGKTIGLPHPTTGQQRGVHWALRLCTVSLFDCLKATKQSQWFFAVKFLISLRCPDCQKKHFIQFLFLRQISDFVAMSRLPKKTLHSVFVSLACFCLFPKVLRTMGSQDWWFGDPKPLLYTKPQWLSGTRWFKVVYGGRDSHLQGSLNHPKKVTSRIWINLRIPNHRAPNQQLTIVGGWTNPLEKSCSPNWIISPTTPGETCLKPPVMSIAPWQRCRSRFPQVFPDASRSWSQTSVLR